jgi:hypothetical protein
MVAKRAELLPPTDQDLIWFLQRLSLKQLASDLIEKFPERIATHAMLSFGVKPGKIYSAEETRKIRQSIWLDDSEIRLRFPLRDDYNPLAPPLIREGRPGWSHLTERGREEMRARLAANDAKPNSYPVEKFLACCREAAKENLERYLVDLCINPEKQLSDAPWYFAGLFDTLREYQSARIEASRAANVVTEIGRKTYDALKYSLASGSMVLIQGDARTGKSFAAKAWCDLNPGKARYCQVPSTSDDFGFYRAIARSIGVTSSEKAQQIRLKIEDSLQRSRLMLVLDEAHYLWLSGSRKEILPKRVNWLLTALVNYGVPVAMIATPQFLRTQKEVEKNSGWTSEQLIGRIYHFVPLPGSLSASDLQAVARSLVPEANEKTIELLVCYAQGSKKYLAGIDAVVKRARFVAQEQGRAQLKFADVAGAIKESVMPSDSALSEALAASPIKPGAKSHRATISFPSTHPPDEARPDVCETAPLSTPKMSHRQMKPMELTEQNL